MLESLRLDLLLPSNLLKIDFLLKQYKVNYAVSERGDRVTGAMTLTRMAGCNGMYWASIVL